MRRSLMVCGWLILGAGMVSAQEKKADPLPAKVGAAWEKAGAEVGWMGTSRIGGYLLFAAKREELVATRVVPAFQIRAWGAVKLTKLPAPAQAFGLKLARSGITDAELKELASLKHLTSIDLGDTRVTAGGLKALTPLKHLTSLSLGDTKLTDA